MEYFSEFFTMLHVNLRKEIFALRHLGTCRKTRFVSFKLVLEKLFMKLLFPMMGRFFSIKIITLYYRLLRY